MPGPLDALESLADLYPGSLRDRQRKDVRRVGFHLELARAHLPRDGRICDLGGGIGLFSLGCAAILGAAAVLVDDFGDPVNRAAGDGVLDIHRNHSVDVVEANILSWPDELSGSRFDMITTFDCIEHLHHSPRTMLHDAVAHLEPGGHLVIGAPNCVNLRKRLDVFRGRGRWTSFEEWYEPNVFRGHVREPSVDDLRRIALDLGLEDVRVTGRNWHGYGHERMLVRIATPILDRPLRLRPQLCADLYMIGRKPAA